MHKIRLRVNSQVCLFVGLLFQRRLIEVVFEVVLTVFQFRRWSSTDNLISYIFFPILF